MGKPITHKARKRFGQNFLHDQNVIQKIIRAINPQPGDHIVEIGPGLGALTCPLLEQLGEIDVIELDRDVIPLLQKACDHNAGLRIHQSDVLKFDFNSLVTADNDAIRVIGNLPYNISTAVLFHLLTCGANISDMLFMLQKEVVERIVAMPGGRDYGRLSVMLQTWFDTTALFTVSAGSFNPAPKVESAIVQLVPSDRYQPRDLDISLYGDLVRQAFSQRRKTLRNTLKPLCDASVLESVDIDPGKRAEQLEITDFIRLHRAIAAN